MMATAPVVGLNAGKRRLSSSFRCSGLNDKFSTRNVVTTAKSSNYASGFQASKRSEPIKAIKERVCVDGTVLSLSSTAEPWMEGNELNCLLEAQDETTVAALLLIRKSMCEKQWKLSFEQTDTNHTTTMMTSDSLALRTVNMDVTSSGTPARIRRRRTKGTTAKKVANVSSELLQNPMKGYVRGAVRDELLTHAQVVELSKKIKVGLVLEDCRSRLKERLGCEPSEEQLATSLRVTRAELRTKLIECTLARERLSMSNIRLVMSIAKKYDNLGADMADLVQGGLIGLLRGVEKFDASKGFKISTYVYWWIRQGVSRTLAERSRTLRLPNYLYERLSLIRNARVRLVNKGITPTTDSIAECLNISHKKIKNATQATRSVLSLDREAFPSLNGFPGATLHSYVADSRVENNPWHGVDESALKGEVNRLIDTTLKEREREVVRLYYGLGNECLTWEDISKRIGVSRERARQVGLVAVDKLKHAARKKRLEAMLLKH